MTQGPTTSPVVGIDLGTTNSLVAISDERGPRILLDDLARPMLPSVVRFREDLPPIVGYEAKEQAASFPATTISSVKRLMGRGVADLADQLPYITFSLAPPTSSPSSPARIALPALGTQPPRLVSPEEVSAHILSQLKQTAERRLGQPIHRAVITVPAYFDDAQRQATRVAGRLAGLDVIRIVPEPTAAALAYGIGLGRASQRLAQESTIAVYDLGGGTFDVSVLQLTPSGTLSEDITPASASSQPTPAPTPAPDTPDPFFFQVLATSGDTRLGGDDFDHTIVSDILTSAPTHTLSPTPTLSPTLRRQLLTTAESLKITLSTQLQASATVTLDDNKPFTYTLTRARFETLIEPLIQRTIDRCQQALRDAKLSDNQPAHNQPAHNKIADNPPAIKANTAPIPRYPQLDSIILVGGSTRVPHVRARVAQFFGLTPYTALDPDQVVALGAAVQASVLSGAASGTLLLDVIPLSLGIETAGGAVAKLIPRNALVPTSATEMFSTSVDGQVSIRLTIYQGEREMAADCRKLAQVILGPLPPMPAGVPQIQVRFLVDANGVLNISALERRSGQRADLQVIPNHGLTQAEADAAEAQAYIHARADMQQHRIVDLIANASLDLKWIHDALARVNTQLDAPYKDSLTAAMSTLDSLITAAKADWTSADPTRLAAAKETLDRLSVRLHETAISQSLRDTKAD